MTFLAELCRKPFFQIATAATVLATALLSASTSVRADDDEKFGPDGIPVQSLARNLPADNAVNAERSKLAERGMRYAIYYTNDILSNVHGGLKRGTIDQGKLEGAVWLDLNKMMGLKDLQAYANGFQIHNTGRMRRDYVGGINTIAAIEAVPTTRLSELWLERKFWEGKASLRVGQLTADTEFFYANLSIPFLQSDWATIAASNMPSGGPAYPLSTPGVRFKYEPNPNATFQLAVYNGDPAGPGTGDEQERNKHGLNFRVKDPALMLTELALRRNQAKTDTGLAGIVKIGAWYHLGKFDDQRLGDDGRLLADPASSGIAFKRRHNNGVYGVVEQQLYRPQGGEAESGVSVYARSSVSPSDRNLIDFYIDGGVIVSGMVPKRPDDKFGAAFIYSRYSNGARGYDADLVSFNASTKAARDYEANLELMYSAQIATGFTLQPMTTFIWHPSGDATRNAVVMGLRSVFQY